MKPSRREFLVLTLSGLGAAMLGACGDDGNTVQDNTPNNDTPFMPDIPDEQMPDARLDIAQVAQAWFEGADAAAIVAVGNVYVQRFAPDEDAVADDLASVVAIFAELEDLTEALEALDAAVITDFEAVEIAAVSGWQLARTEARMCSLFAQAVG